MNDTVTQYISFRVTNYIKTKILNSIKIRSIKIAKNGINGNLVVFRFPLFAFVKNVNPSSNIKNNKSHFF